MSAVKLPALALLLVDARLPNGGHAHSAGAEQAVEDGIVTDLAGLVTYVAGRVASSVVLEAHAAALACDHARAGNLGAVLPVLEDALDARLASPAARAVWRRQGDQYRRAAVRVVGRSLLRRARPMPPARRRSCRSPSASPLPAPSSGHRRRRRSPPIRVSRRRRPPRSACSGSIPSP